MNNLIFITGGAKSGKSLFAENLALNINLKMENNKIAYIATSEKYDDEFYQRIKAHQKRRGTDFQTYEEPKNIDKTIKKVFLNHNIVILECLTTWLGNIQYYFNNDFIVKSENILTTVLHVFNKNGIENNPSVNYSFKQNNLQSDFNFINDLSPIDKVLIIISNEIGYGIVPDNRLSRDFRDQLGKINQITANLADHVFFVISGIANKIK